MNKSCIYAANLAIFHDIAGQIQRKNISLHGKQNLLRHSAFFGLAARRIRDMTGTAVPSFRSRTLKSD